MKDKPLTRALIAAIKKNGWTPTQVAAAALVTEDTCKAWLAGNAEMMRAINYHRLRCLVPGFAKLADQYADELIAA